MEIQNKKQQCFTLIERIIVVAIIGILAAIAIPVYQDYITRSKVTEMVTAADACKTSVAEYFQSQATLPSSTTQAGCSNNSTQYVSILTVTTEGKIQVTASDAIAKSFGASAGKVRSEEGRVGKECVSTCSYRW